MNYEAKQYIKNHMPMYQMPQDGSWSLSQRHREM